MNGLYVITAGPSAGKSSTIRELSARGYRVAPEAARIVLDQLVSDGVEPKKFREENPHKYQERVIETDLSILENLPSDEIVFMDRSAVDNIVYARMIGHDLSDEFIETCKNSYNSAFRLDRIEFTDDYARTEDDEMASIIHNNLKDVYNECGYHVKDVPVMPVDERADYIERYIQRTPIH